MKIGGFRVNVAAPFRVSKDKIIPYVCSSELPHPKKEEEEKLRIKSITLGPGTDESLKRAIREMLVYYGYNDITISNSSVPYRS